MTSPTREPRKVIADTTPIISLALIDQLDLLRAKARGFISEVQPLLLELVQGGIHLGDEVVREALKLAREA
jgi:predicted nucleic acid-binding protein